MSLSTHVLDATAGRPASGVPVRLEVRGEDGWTMVTERMTDGDGRIPDLAGDLAPGDYRLIFDTGDYFGDDTFYPEVVVSIRLSESTAHHHVPLLLSPWAYTTYRGS
jgi:5-hydroxyisourate hydrolase